MSSEHEAVEAVREAIEDAKHPPRGLTFDQAADWIESSTTKQAEAAIKAYQHHLATRSSDAVVQAIQEHAYWYHIRGLFVNSLPYGPVKGENLKTMKDYTAKVQAAETALLALIAEHARGPVVVTDADVERMSIAALEEERRLDQAFETTPEWHDLHPEAREIRRAMTRATISAIATPVAADTHNGGLR